jgi:hypothetical protein
MLLSQLPTEDILHELLRGQCRSKRVYFPLEESLVIVLVHVKHKLPLFLIGMTSAPVSPLAVRKNNIHLLVI